VQLSGGGGRRSRIESNTSFPYLSNVPEKKDKRIKNEKYRQTVRLSKQMTIILYLPRSAQDKRYIFLHQLRTHISLQILLSCSIVGAPD
jgi:hypothetical protein